MSDIITHEAKVLGFPVVFKFDPDKRKMGCQWEPHLPDISRWTVFQQRRFTQEYRKARATFGQKVADAIDAPWAVMDLDDEGLWSLTTFKPKRPR